MTSTSTRRPAGSAGHDVRNAWLSVLLLPIAFGLAFLIGEGLIGLFGYPVGDTAGEAPLWAILAATIPALLVFCLPALLSSWFARRAASHGDRRGWVPATLLAVVALAFIAMNVLAGLGLEMQSG
ncbi:hypothetical protein O9K63_10655 [Janibacter cremeus]|uniref:hypothetical protein n=1 Tax=Janibacter cremeus TaxID=1285192 RepID=UPI0023F9DFAC|nr:hypothetical protein [Janibacter cremeus]WEV77052.1 hypothetical protein O9K63_10655 [Janibacter cremeus]